MSGEDSLTTTQTDIEARAQSTIVDPRDGQVLDLATIGHLELTGIFQALKHHEVWFKEMRIAAEEELVRRQGRQKTMTIADVEVEVDRKFSRSWDVESLMAAISYLVQDGLLFLSEAEGLVTEEMVLKPDGKKLAALLTKLEQEGRRDPLEELKSCFEWTQGRATVKVTPAPDLEG